MATNPPPETALERPTPVRDGGDLVDEEPLHRCMAAKGTGQSRKLRRQRLSIGEVVAIEKKPGPGAVAADGVTEDTLQPGRLAELPGAADEDHSGLVG